MNRTMLLKLCQIDRSKGLGQVWKCMYDIIQGSDICSPSMCPANYDSWIQFNYYILIKLVIKLSYNSRESCVELSLIDIGIRMWISLSVTA